MSNDDLLPVGTIVKINDEYNLDYMIIGYTPFDEDGNATVYSAVLYPFGIEIDGNLFMLNKEDIKDIIFKGYKNDKDGFFDIIKKAFMKI